MLNHRPGSLAKHLAYRQLTRSRSAFNHALQARATERAASVDGRPNLVLIARAAQKRLYKIHEQAFYRGKRSQANARRQARRARGSLRQALRIF